ncbi:hypothetical protein TNCV_4475491 [Trichonephila clavipes]|nr:hypothetical protein TNCV_4475491 [Trichonephila clavipes]
MAPCWMIVSILASLYRLFSFCTPVGRYKKASDVEISAIQTTLSKLQCQYENFSRTVMLSDSRTTFVTISSAEAPVPVDTLKIHLALNA